MFVYLIDSFDVILYVRLLKQFSVVARGRSASGGTYAGAAKFPLHSPWDANFNKGHQKLHKDNLG